MFILFLFASSFTLTNVILAQNDVRVEECDSFCYPGLAYVASCCRRNGFQDGSSCRQREAYCARGELSANAILISRALNNVANSIKQASEKLKQNR